MRTLKDRYMEDHSAMTHAQIMNLKKALSDQKYANVWCSQFAALCCYYVSDLYWLTYIVGLYFQVNFTVAHYILGLSVWEIQISAKSLEIYLGDMEKLKNPNKPVMLSSKKNRE